MKVNCENPNCGKRITKTPRDLRRHKHHFCNNKCYQEFRSLTGYGMPKKGCEQNIDMLMKMRHYGEVAKSFI